MNIDREKYKRAYPIIVNEINIILNSGSYVVYGSWSSGTNEYFEYLKYMGFVYYKNDRIYIPTCKKNDILDFVKLDLLL